MTAIYDQIEAIFARHGDESYGEGITQLQHALQAAALAQSEGAASALVVAALLHDVGHFLQPTDDNFGYHKHDRSGGDWLRAQGFPEAVAAPVRLHVAAKRYLCGKDPSYQAQLSPASTYTLSKQGGPMNPAECAAFEAEPFFAEGVRLRRWDDEGKKLGWNVAPLESYRAAIEAIAPAR
jgi:gamma-butyrobetaine dioxygenase